MGVVEPDDGPAFDEPIQAHPAGGRSARAGVLPADTAADDSLISNNGCFFICRLRVGLRGPAPEKNRVPVLQRASARNVYNQAGDGARARPDDLPHAFERGRVQVLVPRPILSGFVAR